MVFIIVHTPWPTSKGSDHSYLHVYACLLLCFMLVLASLVLGFTTFDALSGFGVVWLHPTPMRPCSDVTIWEASLDAELFCAYSSLFHSTWCYACHACLRHPLAFYASLHACLHIHAWVLFASVSFILQHNKAMDIWSKPTFVPCGHHPFVCLLACLPCCLFASYLACLPYRLFAHILFSMFAISTMFICFMPLSCALCIFSFHCLSTGFLSLPLHVHTWSDDAWS